MTPQLSSEQATALVEEDVYFSVRSALDVCGIFELEERLGYHFAVLGLRGTDILRAARVLIAGAFRRIAEQAEAGWTGFDEHDDLRAVYLAAIEAEQKEVVS